MEEGARDPAFVMIGYVVSGGRALSEGASDNSPVEHLRVVRRKVPRNVMMCSHSGGMKSEVA